MLNINKTNFIVFKTKFVNSKKNMGREMKERHTYIQTDTDVLKSSFGAKKPARWRHMIIFLFHVDINKNLIKI